MIAVLLWLLGSLAVLALNGWRWAVGFAIVTAPILWLEWRDLAGAGEDK